MENQTNQPSGAKQAEDNHDNTIGGAQSNTPDAESQNDTGYDGTTNSVSESRNKDSYQIAPEDTMIGYDGHDEQMDMDIGEEDKLRSGKTGNDDNS